MSDFKTKMHQIRFPLGLGPRTRWGSLQSSPDSLAVFKGVLLRRGMEIGMEQEEGKGRGGKGGRE